jgi:5'-nucleotidase
LQQAVLPVNKIMPHILITNDDGIYAEGLRALVTGLQELGTISVVAPSQERSAAGQSLTLRQPIFAEQVAEREWSIDGTPADGMIVAMHQLLPQKPDLVVSGINRGGNMGENVYYSGTVGAAMEGVINHVPSLAISAVYRTGKFDYAGAAQFTRKLASMVLSQGLPAGVMLNVNIPPDWKGGVRITRQSQKVTRNVLKEGIDPRGRTYYWLSEEELIQGVDSDSDYAAVFAGAISITPLALDRTHGNSMQSLADWSKQLERAKDVLESSTLRS